MYHSFDFGTWMGHWSIQTACLRAQNDHHGFRMLSLECLLHAYRYNESLSKDWALRKNEPHVVHQVEHRSPELKTYLYCYLIQCPIIHSIMPRSILLSDHQHQKREWTSTRANNYWCEQLFHNPFDLIFLKMRISIRSCIERRGSSLSVIRWSCGLNGGNPLGSSNRNKFIHYSNQIIRHVINFTFTSTHLHKHPLLLMVYYSLNWLKLLGGYVFWASKWWFPSVQFEVHCEIIEIPPIRSLWP